MSQATFIDHKGKAYAVEVGNDTNLMQAAIDNLVPGILGECGGDCACATCHVFVDPAWAGRSGTPSELEAQMLDGLVEIRETSRLCCQIRMREELDGIVLHLPESQL